MMHPELAAGVSGVVHARGLWVAHVDHDEVTGCQLLKPGPVSSPLLFAWFHQSPSFIDLGDSYCDTIDGTYKKL